MVLNPVASRDEVRFGSGILGTGGPTFESLPEGFSENTSNGTVGYGGDGLYIETNGTAGDHAGVSGMHYGSIHYGNLPEFEVVVLGTFSNNTEGTYDDYRIGFVNASDSSNGMYWDISTKEFVVGTTRRSVSREHVRTFVLQITASRSDTETTFKLAINGQNTLVEKFSDVNTSAPDHIIYRESAGNTTTQGPYFGALRSRGIADL